MDNTPVEKVDIMSYAGKWYSLYSIPSYMERQRKETTETYVIHPDGYYAVFTSFRVPGEKELRYERSKLFVVRGTGNAEMKAQFVWPVRVDYWIIEMDEDYSYAVIGHPRNKHLCIMSRRPELDESLLHDILERCAAKGYDTSKLVSQEHRPLAQKVPARS